MYIFTVLQLEERLLKTAKDKMEQLSKVLSGSKEQLIIIT